MNLSILIKIAKNEAKKSNHKFFKMSAIIFNKNTVISKGFNKVFNMGKSNSPTLHAEIMSINKALKIGYNLKNKSIFVIRLSPNEPQLRNSKPCNNCMASIIYNGITNVYYIDNYELVHLHLIRKGDNNEKIIFKEKRRKI